MLLSCPLYVVTVDARIELWFCGVIPSVFPSHSAGWIAVCQFKFQINRFPNISVSRNLHSQRFTKIAKFRLLYGLPCSHPGSSFDLFWQLSVIQYCYSKIGIYVTEKKISYDCCIDTYLGGAIFVGSTSFRKSCCKDCSEVILLDGSSINMRSSRSSATGGRLNRPNIYLRSSNNWPWCLGSLLGGFEDRNCYRVGPGGWGTKLLVTSL